jgi:hypothetical protein
MNDLLFDGEETITALRALADLLQEARVPHQEIIIVGGSYLAILNLRRATRDVDSITRIAFATKQAIAEIGRAHGYDAEWLNDAAASFYPIGLTIDHCTVLFKHPALTVLGPSADWIFLMKLDAARTVDFPDLQKLWAHTGFRNADEAVERFKLAYPMSPDDPYLTEFVNEIIQSAK